MIYVPLDIETTGTDPKKDQVLEIAAVIEDTKAFPLPSIKSLPHWRGRILHRRIKGSPVALAMNAGLIADMAEAMQAAEPDALHFGPSWHLHTLYAERELISFIHEHTEGKIVFAGKNVAGFDLRFLPRLRAEAHHRTIDAGSIALGGQRGWWSYDTPPSLEDLKGGEVAHTALQDARDVVTAIRKSTDNYGRDT